ncbi:MAG: hypothetical protein QW510_05865 [Candidatus Bathyarchaeia archaeon]
MEISERRVIGALLLLLGVTMFAVGLYTGQLNVVLELLRKAFST